MLSDDKGPAWEVPKTQEIMGRVRLTIFRFE